MHYSIDYFIIFYAEIPENLWCINCFTDGNKHCAIRHCEIDIDTGLTNYVRLASLQCLFVKYLNGRCIPYVNDGVYKEYQQPTPKQRMLAALREIKVNMAAKELQKIMDEQKTPALQHEPI